MSCKEVYLNETMASMSAGHRSRFIDLVRTVSFDDNAYATYLRDLENTWQTSGHKDDFDHWEHRAEAHEWCNPDGSIKERHFLGQSIFVNFPADKTA